MKVNLINRIDGESRSVVLIELPKYTGEYTYTPTKEDQTIKCKDKQMLHNLEIEAIPDEYIETGDATAVSSDILQGKTAYAKSQKLVGTCTYDADTSDDTATSSDILQGKTAHSKGELITGLIPEKGQKNIEILDKNQTEIIEEGFYTGGTVKIKDDEKNKIIPDNIKKDVEILGVMGTYETAIVLQKKTVKSTTTSQTITPDTGYDGIDEITVSPVVMEEKVVKSDETGKEILPSTGKDGISKITLLPVISEAKTVKSTETRQTITPGTGKDYISEITVEPIVKQKKTVKSTTTSQTITPDSGYDYIDEVEVEPVVLEEKVVKSTETGQEILPSTGKDGISKITVSPIISESKTVKSGNSQQIITPGTGKDYISEITVQPINNQSKTITPTTASQIITPDSNYDGLSSVSVEAIPPEYVIPTGTKTITENGTYDVSEFEEASVNVGGGIPEEFLTRPFSASYDIELSANVENIGGYALYYYTSLKKITLPNAEKISSRAFSNCQNLITVEAPKLNFIDTNAFEMCSKLQNMALDGGNIWKISSQAFNNCSKFAPDKIIINTTGRADYDGKIDSQAFLSSGKQVDTPYTVKVYQVGTTAMSINYNSFGRCTKLKQFNFVSHESTQLPRIDGSSFDGCTALTDIYVPWSEGKVANAPWGATNATIHYDTVFDANGDPII